MTKEQKQSDALDLLLDETVLIAICITNEDQATQNDIAQWVDDIVENIETIRTALTEHAAIKGQDHITDASEMVDKLDIKSLEKKCYDHVYWVHRMCDYIHPHSPSINSTLNYLSSQGYLSDCLSNPPQSDNQTVLTGEDDSQVDALEAENARLRDAISGLFKALYAYGSQGSEYNKAIQVAEQALKGQDNDTE